MKPKHHRHEEGDKAHEYAGMSDTRVVALDKSREVDTNIEHRLHSRFAKSLPEGVLAIHFKRCVKVKLDVDTHFNTKSDISTYIRYDIGHQHKCSHIKHCDLKKNFLLFDDIKHFLCEVNNYRHCPTNTIVIELVAFEDKEHHIRIAKMEIHLFEILKRLYTSETYPLYHGKKVVAEAEIEFVFAYGCFGYGYSNQLVNRKHTPNEQIAHSLFFRQEPLDERKLENVPDVASCLPIGHPPFIPFTERCEIGTTARDFDFDVDVHELCRKIDDPILLVKKIRKRMWKLQGQYEELRTRKERLHYLEKIITPKPDDLLEKRMKKHPDKKDPKLTEIKQPSSVIKTTDDHTCPDVGLGKPLAARESPDRKSVV